MKGFLNAPKAGNWIVLYEAVYDEDVPVGVAVNEAVELAKEYGNDNGPSFVNGILGNIVNE